MDYNKEDIRLLFFEEDSGFRTFLQSLLHVLGYRHITIPETQETAHVLLDKDDGFSACLIGLNTHIEQQTGLKIAAQIREQAVFTPLIFLSQVYNEEMYAICRPFQPSAFLNKELSGFKLQLALEQALLHRAGAEKALLEKTNQMQLLAQPLFFKTAEGFVAIPEKEILYFYSNQKTSHARTPRQTYDTQVQLQTLEKALGEHFIRIHKSYLINVNFIEAIQPNESSVMIGGQTLPVGYAYRKSFFNRIKLLR